MRTSSCSSDGSRLFVERLAFSETAGRNERGCATRCSRTPSYFRCAISTLVRPLTPRVRNFGRKQDRWTSPSSISLTVDSCRVQAGVTPKLGGQLWHKRWTTPEPSVAVVFDLQRQVAAASSPWQRPFEHAGPNPGLSEQQFIDDTTRAMRSGRFLLIIAGDGIREDVTGIAELINRNAASAFRSHLLRSRCTGSTFKSRHSATSYCQNADDRKNLRSCPRWQAAWCDDCVEESDIDESGLASGNAIRNEFGESPIQAQYRAFWTPVINTPLTTPTKNRPSFTGQTTTDSPPWPTCGPLPSLRRRHRSHRRGQRTEPVTTGTMSALEPKRRTR